MAPAWPAIAALLTGALLLRARPPSERTLVRIATVSLTLSLASILAGAVLWARGGFRPMALALGSWFRAGDYGMEVIVLLDGASVPVSLTAAVLVLATCRFSAGYLHREPGFGRFFLLILCFAAGAQVVFLSGSLDMLFAGWEVVGLCSVLLVAFFHDRTGPVRAAIRVLVTYRVCDVGLVLAAILLHRSHHSTAFLSAAGGALQTGSHAPAAAGVTALALALVVAAMGKSAQFPVGGWLPRAMEGPTASSAVFYGGLSVHAGVFLLVRAAPWLDASPAARVVVIVVGAATAVMATLSAQVSADAKTALAHAAIAQVGLLFIECGAGLYRLAVVHLCAHAILRYYQFLRTPSVLQDALARRAALGATTADEAAARWELLGLARRRFLYRLSIERFEVEAFLHRWLVRPLLGLSTALGAVERRLFAGPAGSDPEGDSPHGSDAPSPPPASRSRRPAQARAVAAGALLLILLAAVYIAVYSPVSVAPGAIFGADRMSSVLLVSSAALVLAILIGAPRADLDTRATFDLLLGAAAAIAVLVSNHVWLFLAGWALSVVPLARDALRSRDRAARRAAGFLALLSVLPMAIALTVAAVGTLTRSPGHALDFASLATSPFVREWQSVLGALAMIAVATRTGLFPLHLWIPAAIERARLPIAMQVVLAPVGSFASVKVLVVLFPHLAQSFGPSLVAWATASACYGALLALASDDVRRQLAYLRISAASSVLAGAGTHHALALGGALFHDVTTTAALLGLLLVAGAVRARTGTSDMRRLGGIVQHAPRVAAGYLLLGLAFESFPGTAGFVAEHLLVQGLHELNPAIAAVLLTATAVNGITLVRSYKRVFLGPPSPAAGARPPIPAALPRERWVLAALVVLLLAGWLFPAPLLRLRESVAVTLPD
ncbi:MAG: proton-conducting transporter membrane subunit [Polyangiaceae bacterium]